VFGLGQQVGGDPVGVVGAVGDHQHLRGTGDGIDADRAENPAFGGGDIDIAGSDDLVDRADRLGAVGQRADRLCAADAVGLGDPGQACCRHHRRVEPAIRGRHYHDPAFDAGDLGRQRVHQHRGRIGGGATGHVEAGGGDRGPAVAQAQTGRVGVVQVLGQLAPVVGLDAAGGEFQRRHDLGRTARRRRGDLGLRDAQSLRRQADTVEAFGEIDQGRIAAYAQFGQNFVDDPGDVGLGVALDREEGLEGGLEAGRARVQPMRHRRPPGIPRSSD
jgi:hypothetical protein